MVLSCGTLFSNPVKSKSTDATKSKAMTKYIKSCLNPLLFKTLVDLVTIILPIKKKMNIPMKRPK